MARKAMIEKYHKPQRFKTRKHNRCNICGRPRGYLRKFDMCRICFRKLAGRGEIPGIIKASW